MPPFGEPKEPVQNLEALADGILKSDKDFGKKKADITNLMLSHGIDKDTIKEFLTRHSFYGEIGGAVEMSTQERGEASNDTQMEITPPPVVPSAAPVERHQNLPYLDRDDDELVPDPNHPGEMIMKKYLNS